MFAALQLCTKQPPATTLAWFLGASLSSPFVKRFSALPEKRTWLLRDFIYNSLYHNVSRPARRLVGQLEYRLTLERIYQQLQVSWLTPSEIFRPWYGHAIAKYILEYHQYQLGLQTPLTIYEIGGGTGTLAADVLDFIRDEAPATYRNATYTCLEVSPKLAQLQLQRVLQGGRHRGKFSVLRKNAMERSSWAERTQEHCFVLAMEVLDNLPHDRVVWRGGQWLQTAVEGAAAAPSEQQWQEVLQPVSDPLIQRCLSALGDSAGPASLPLMQRMQSWGQEFMAGQPLGSRSRTAFLPTGALAMMDTLHSMRPHHALIAADFDSLPGVMVPGRNAPLVAGRAGGVTTDFDTLYVPWGTADIYFPTDFDELATLYHQAAQDQGISDVDRVQTSHINTREFMARFADHSKTRTLTNYNPLLDDYRNTRIFIASLAPELRNQSL